MYLSAKNVKKVFLGCMYKRGISDTEDIPNGSIVVEGINSNVVFDPEMVNANKEDIRDFISQIMDDFSSVKDKGSSFINLPFNKDKKRWGDDVDAEQLMILCIAAGYMKYLTPSSEWINHPGGKPVLFVSIDEDNTAPVNKDEL